LEKQDFLAFNTDTYGEPNLPWYQKAYSFRKQFQEWFNHTLGQEIPKEIYEEMRSRGIRRWEGIKREMWDHFAQIKDHNKWHKKRKKEKDDDYKREKNNGKHKDDEEKRGRRWQDT
jgi:hypothetical protein